MVIEYHKKIGDTIGETIENFNNPTNYGSRRHGVWFFLRNNHWISIQKADIYYPQFLKTMLQHIKHSCTELNISRVFENQHLNWTLKLRRKVELLKKRENFDNTTLLQLKILIFIPIHI
jgi:hypothetical protein